MSVYLVAQAVAAAATAVALYAGWQFLQAYWRWRFSPLRALPGPPWRNFWLGEMLTVQREPFMAPHKRWWKEAAAARKKTEADDDNGVHVPMLCFTLLVGRPTVVLLDADLVQEVLIEQSSRDPVRFPKNYTILQNTLGDGLVSLEGSHWYRHRRIIQPSFHNHVLKQALNVSVPHHVATLIAAWQRAGPRRAIDLDSHLAALTLNVIGDVAFGYEFGALRAVQQWATDPLADPCLETSQDPVNVALGQIFKPTPLIVLLALARQNFFYKLAPGIATMTQRLNQACDAVIAQARQSDTQQKVQQQQPRSLLQLLFYAKDQEKDVKNCARAQTLSDTELRDEMKTFMVAGHETTSTWAYWACYALAIYPDIQQCVYEDVCQHVKNDESSANDVDIDAVHHMSYLWAFLQEVLRYYSPVGYVVRYNARDECWHGQVIPAGTRCSIPIHLLHRHPRYWKDDPERFAPDRWLHTDQHGTLVPPYRHKFSFVPFSAGPRNCVGQRFATLEVQLIVAALARSFCFRLAPGLRPEEVTFTAFGTMKAKPAIRVCVQARQGTSRQ